MKRIKIQYDTWDIYFLKKEIKIVPTKGFIINPKFLTITYTALEDIYNNKEYKKIKFKNEMAEIINEKGEESK